MAAFNRKKTINYRKTCLEMVFLSSPHATTNVSPIPFLRYITRALLPTILTVPVVLLLHKISDIDQVKFPISKPYSSTV